MEEQQQKNNTRTEKASGYMSDRMSAYFPISVPRGIND